MEKRAILALLLCGAVLVIHMTIVMPLLRPPQPEGVETPAETGTQGEAAQAPPAPPPENQQSQSPAVPEPQTPSVPPVPAPEGAAAAYMAADQDTTEVRTLTLANDIFTSTWTNAHSGACETLTFEQFYKTIAEKHKFQFLGIYQALVPAEGPERPTLALRLESPELKAALGDMVMKVAESSPDSATFEGKILRLNAETKQYEDHLKITKTVRLVPERYEIAVDFTVQNLTLEPATLNYTVVVVEGITIEGNDGELGTARLAALNEDRRPSLEDRPVAKFKDGKPWSQGNANLLWAGVDDRYFAGILMSREGAGRPMLSVTYEPIKVRLLEGAEPMLSVRVNVNDHMADIAAGAAQTRKYTLFVGPKKDDVLEQYAVLNFPGMIDYGMFGSISQVLIIALKWTHAVVGNYGVAIVLLTVVMRVLLHPLTKKQQVSMHKMAKLKPMIEELKKKYKNDKQKFGTEQMALFKKHGVNPLSGCLPMVLQMPILIALFWMLRLTFELRQEPFALWIKDLSLPDTVGYLPKAIPFLGGAAINILPILMAVAMFIQQKLMPKSDDPQAQQQQKIMGIMPIFFTFLFYKFPSGLCLYWFTSTVLGLGEQVYIRRHLDALDAAGAGATVSVKNGKRK